MKEERTSNANWNLALIILLAVLGVLGAALLFSREAFPLPEYTQYLPIVLIAITEPIYLCAARFLPLKNVPESCTDKTGLTFCVLSILLTGISLLLFALCHGGTLQPDNTSAFYAAAGLIAGAPVFALHIIWRIVEALGDKEIAPKKKTLYFLITTFALVCIAFSIAGAIQGNLSCCLFLLVLPISQIIDLNNGAE